ncbi:MAG: GNAT family N-acetyltransferase [Candidatus Cryptobacteroides sp.]
MKYIKATVEDIPAIRRIAKVVFPATYSSIISREQIDFMMDWMYSEDTLRKELTGDVTYLLPVEDGAAVGYVSFSPDGVEGQYHLHKIYLLPDFQGRGYGRELFLAAENEMRRLGVEAFELNVNRHNKALDFYIRMGMEIDRSGDFDIGGGFYMNDYIMRKNLTGNI